MAKVTSRAQLSEYCLKKLGKPVIRINVSADQIDDRIDEALEAFGEKHYDGTEKTWVAYEVVQADIDRGYVIVPDDIMVIDQLLPMSSVLAANGSDGVFSYRYQTVIQNLSPWRPLDLISYYMTMTNLGEVDGLINANERFQHTRHLNKLDVYGDYLTVGKILCFHVFKLLDPELHPKVYNDKWVKAYATACIKRQWGSNMKKHGEIQLLGGVTVNGQQLFDEALVEIEALETQLAEVFSEPLDFFIG